MKSTIILPLLGISYIPAVVTANENVDKKPNLLVIMTDEHNFRTLGCYRNTLSPNDAFLWGRNNFVETPHIDRIASMGVLCTGFYAVNPVSSPTRSSFFTGMYPQTTGVLLNNMPMKDEMVTFGQSLQDYGYYTAYLGKWHLENDDKPGWAPVRKFGFENNKYMYNRGHWKNIKENARGPYVDARNAKGEIAEAQLGDADEKCYTTDFLIDRTIEIIKTKTGKPFCCVVSIPDPHGPNLVREPHASMYSKMKFDRPSSEKAPTAGMPPWAMPGECISDTPEQLAKYYGMVKLIDDNMGKLLKTLEEMKILDNTIIVFTADHGDMLGEHGQDNKGVPYEASAKVPMLIYYKGVVKPGSVTTAVMNSVDFAPTILSLMGIKTNVKHEGRDCSKIIKGEKLPANWTNMTISRNDRWIAAVSPDFKLIYTADNKSAPVLFSLKEDPLETKNYFGDKKYMAVVKEMSKFILDTGNKYNEPILKNQNLFNQIKQYAQ